MTDPFGAALYDFYSMGELKAEGSSVAEGIGQGRITANLEGRRRGPRLPGVGCGRAGCRLPLLAEEGLCLGRSTGIDAAGAVRLARDMGPGHTIVTILCDYGTALPI